MDVDPSATGVVEAAPGGSSEPWAGAAQTDEEVLPSLEAFLSQLREANGIIRQLHVRSEQVAQRQQLVKRGPAVASIDPKQEPLFARRLELLFASQSEEGAEDKLPAYERFPEATTDVHALIMSGAVPDGHQKVAHILYPEEVQWPAGATVPEPQALDAENSLDGFVALEHGKLLLEVDVTNPHQEDSLGGAADATSAQPHNQGDSSQPSLQDAPKEVVILRNQKLTTRARGGPVVLSQEGSAKPAAVELNESELKAAKEKRKEAQKSLALEAYREQKLKERLTALEQSKQAELAFQEDLAKREVRRKAREAELRKMTKEAHEKRQQAQQEAEEEKKKQQAAEAQVTARRKEYHARQKERLVEWDLKRFHDDGSPVEPSVSEATADAPKPRVHQSKTPKELEVEAHIKLLQTALEERPPVPPCLHEEKVPSRKPKEPWTVEAQAISDAYGLTVDEHTAIIGKTKG